MIDIKCSFEQKICQTLTKEVNHCESQSFRSDIHDLKQWDAVWLDHNCYVSIWDFLNIESRDFDLVNIRVSMH